MAVACASRFAVLKLEDDDVTEAITKKSVVQSTKQTVKAKTNGKNSVNDNKPKSKKKKKATEIAELQNLAFASNSKPKHKSSGPTKPINAVPEKQWEEWKQKDSEFVSEAYEQDLQEALLLSKIDYEEKKDVYDATKKETELNKMNPKKKKKSSQKKDKSKMSLDEFQSLDPCQIESGNFQKSIADLDDFELPAKPTIVPDETDFFHKIEEDAEKIITKEQKHEQFKAIDPQIESARLLQYQEDVRQKDEEIAKLKEKVNKLKEELKNVKSRNKKLYGILDTGEMREKAEILIQIEQLISVKDELNDQLSEYHTALEQERSKVHALQTELKKCQSSKKQRTESK